MYKQILTASFLAISTFAHAQDAKETPKPKQEIKNEIGLLLESGYNNSDFNGMFGLQYKRKVRSNTYYRLSIGYGEYNYNADPVFQTRIGDTLVQSRNITRVPMVYLSNGLELQRHFYKHIMLYASIDLRIGYGSGWYDSSTEIHVDNHLGSYFSSTGVKEYSGVNVFYVGLLPYIGAKFEFRRISFGMELSALQCNYRSVSYPTATTQGQGSMFDMGAGDLSQRFYFNFRF